MTALDAKRVVLRYAESRKINASWVADALGEGTRQSVSNWLSGRPEPRDPMTWVRMAYALGLVSTTRTEVEELARDLALSVVSESTSPEARSLAVRLLRKISEKT